VPDERPFFPYQLRMMQFDDHFDHDSLRILMMTTSFPNFSRHGSGSFIFQQARSLAELGHHVTVLCPAAPGLALQEDMEGVEVHRFRYAPEKLQQVAYGGGIPANLAEKKMRWLAVPGFMYSFARHAKRLSETADVIHAHWTAAGVAARQACKKRPLVLSFHGSDLMSPSAFLKKMAIRAAKSASAVIVHSRDMEERARTVAENSRIHLIPHGVDTETVVPGQPANPPEIVFVGRLAPEKGPDILLRAYAHLLKPDARLVFVGSGPMMKDLLAEAAELRVQDRVDFVGEQPHPEALRRISQAAVCVVSSRREGFSVACLEAMAAGRPIVATRCGGPEELIQDERTGLLVPVGNDVALAQAMERLLRERSRAKTLGDAARQQAVAVYDRKTIVRRMEKVYFGVCKAS
jgi:glycosyltransferase involved in cell wall biosynthesis